MEEALVKFLEDSIQKLSKAKIDPNNDESLRSSFDYTEQAYKNILEKVNWLKKTSALKQSHRILQVAKDREQDWDVSNQLKEIALYSKLQEVIPYIQAVSYVINNEDKHLTEDLLAFCQNQLDAIDSTPHKRKIFFPKKEEVQAAFESYLNRIKPNRIPSLKVYKQPEVNQKIEELYQMFLSYSTSV